MLRVIGHFRLYLDPTGFAAAKIDVRAFSVVMMPALAIETVCCSITSCRTLRVASDILSNSSMQHTPPSESTRAPLIKTSGCGFQQATCYSPFEHKLLRIGVAGNVRRQTDCRRALA